MVERLGTPAVLVGIYKVANSPLVEYICNWACKLVSSIWKGRVRVANYQVRTCRHGWTFEAQILPRVTRPVSRRVASSPRRTNMEMSAEPQRLFLLALFSPWRQKSSQRRDFRTSQTSKANRWIARVLYCTERTCIVSYVQICIVRMRAVHKRNESLLRVGACNGQIPWTVICWLFICYPKLLRSARLSRFALFWVLAFFAFFFSSIYNRTLAFNFRLVFLKLKTLCLLCVFSFAYITYKLQETR